MTEFVQNALSVIGGAALSAGYFVIAHYPKIKAGFQAATKTLEHLEQNKAAVAAAKEVEQAAALPTGTDPAVRELLIKDALRDGLAALQIEAVNVDPTNRAALIKFAQSKLPAEAQPLVAPAIDVLLQSIQNGLAAAQQHDAIKAAVTLKPTA